MTTATARNTSALRPAQIRNVVRQLVRHLLKLHAAGEHTVVELAELFEVSQPTVYRVLERAGTTATASAT